MRLLLIALLVLSSGFFSQAAPLPMTTSDISLMLRTGYSSKTILQELALRHFADTFDASSEMQLIHSGATPDLLGALRSGHYSVSPEAAARAKQERQAEADRRARQAQAARHFDTLYQEQLARTRAAEAVKQLVDEQQIYQQLKGDLVQWHNGVVNRFDDSSLENKKLFLFYFSAHWCAPCRKFTPKLVQYYNEVAPKHPEFELVFVSRDKTPFGMETYMRDTDMPWPAIDYQKIAAKPAINKYAGSGIPDLVLVDSSGKVIASSYQGGKYVGPAKVLQSLDAILSKNSDRVAKSR